jgi:FlaA1/EpsC-like NDP-sugar epimerase
MMQGKKLNGIRVYHPRVLTNKFKRQSNIEAIILADSKLTASLKSDIIQLSLNLGVEILEAPSVEKWLNGQMQIHQIQKVKITDLLGRDPIELNQKRIGIHLTGKVVMVTGAAGSIGSEIMRQLIRFKFKKIILVDQAETPMFHLGNELKNLATGPSQIQMLLADVTNPAKMDQIFNKYRPDIIYHAAAYKHVPLIEENPTEAIRVNVGGTKLLTELSEKYGAQKFVLISTDKAVNPANVMGTSKRICEIIVQNKAQQKDIKTHFVITRFGNVLGSNGSVIPIFTKQIENGGPITVTHPDITRYFMTIPEACQLVLEAGFMGKGGEIFEFDMGEPVKIVDLANQMIRLSGLEPGKDIQIVFTGLRPGEKLYEELHTDYEKAKPTYHPKIRIAQVRNDRDIDTMISIDTLLYNLYNISKPDLVKYCRVIVPEFFNAETMQMEKEGNLTQPSVTS